MENIMCLNEKWFAVVNPSSANGKTGDKWPSIYHTLIESGIDLEYQFTSEHGNGIEITKKAINNGHERIIAVGGDGTVNEVINGLFTNEKLVNQNVKLAILGLGTGSDFIRTSKIKTDINAFIDLLKNNTPIKCDVGIVNHMDSKGNTKEHYFINASNIGIGADVVNCVNSRSKVLGSKLTYLTGTIQTIAKYKNFHASILLDNNIKIESNFCGIVICNGQYIGGGMHIAPEALIDDGLFDIIVIKDISKIRLFSRFPLIYKGKHINLPEIEVYRSSKISIETNLPTLLETDGEIPGYLPGQYRILPQCLSIMI